MISIGRSIVVVNTLRSYILDWHKISYKTANVKMSRHNTKAKSTTSKKGQNQSQIKKDDWTGLSFRVPPEFARDFKVYAAKNDYKLVELLKEGFYALKKQNRDIQK